jgi:hypothetical protein
MTDLPQPVVPPVSPIAQFGVHEVGPQFAFSAPTDDGRMETVEARAVAQLSFDQWVEYQAYHAVQQAGIIAKSKEASDRLEMLADPKTTPDEMRDAMNTYLETVRIRERAEWESRVDNVLLLVEPSYRAALRPLLIRSGSRPVFELRAWLEEKVVGVTIHQVQAVAQVDPTSPLSQSDTAPSDDSGPASDDTEPSSTD